MDQEKSREKVDFSNLSATQDKTPINFNFSPPRKKSRKGLYIVIILLVAFLSTGFFFRSNIKALVMGGSNPTPAPSPVTTEAPAPEPEPTPSPFIRSEWSFEVLNGSGGSGLAKKVAEELTDLGYQVFKTGNADKSNYKKTEIFVKKELMDKIDLVVADLKDTLKIASVAGELKEGTASARIILGKDSI